MGLCTCQVDLGWVFVLVRQILDGFLYFISVTSKIAMYIVTYCRYCTEELKKGFYVQKYILKKLKKRKSPKMIVGWSWLKKKKNILSCLDEAFPEGVHSLYPPKPLCTPLPGHPLILPHCPHSPLGQLVVAWPHLVQLGQQAVNLKILNLSNLKFQPSSSKRLKMTA